MFNLDGKVALITGATGGIGMSIAKQMKSSGAKLILSPMTSPVQKMKRMVL